MAVSPSASPDQYARLLVGVSTGDRDDSLKVRPVNVVARDTGLKSGTFRPESLSPERTRKVKRIQIEVNVP